MHPRAIEPGASRLTRTLAAALAAILALADARANEPTLDAFDDLGAWRAVPSDGVALAIHPGAGRDGPGMAIDIDFTSGAGFGVVQRDLKLDLDGDYEFSFWVRGDLPDNNFEFKLVDDAGDSVWWVNRRAFEFPREWTRVAYKRRHLSFAWGPSGGAPLRRTSRIEFAIASAKGGRGTVWIDDLRFRRIEPRPRDLPPIRAATPDDAGAVVDGDRSTSWTPPADAPARFVLDLGVAREFGGVIVHAEEHPTAGALVVEHSLDGASWSPPIRGAWSAGVGVARVQDGDARFVRVSLDAPRAIREVELLPLETGDSPNAFVAAIASRWPRGVLPEPMAGRMRYWTVIGVPGGRREALVGDDGRVEVAKRQWSLEPFIAEGGRLLTWADGAHEQSLLDECLPIPSVARTHDGLTLTTTAFADGKPEASFVHVRHTIINTGPAPRRADLVLAARPFQVNPPSQWLNTEGGCVPWRSREAGEGAMVLNAHAVLWPRGAERTRSRDDPSALADLDTHWALVGGRDFAPERARGEHATLVRLPFDLKPRESRSWWSLLVLEPGIGVPALDAGRPTEEARAAAWHEERLRAVADDWRSRVGAVSITLPPSRRRLERAIRAQLAYVLINADGPGFQPGSRSYERSWIRDGSMTSAAMHEHAFAREARAFVEWYAPYQFESGKVPCVVDERGPDPVPEHDSHGQLIFAIVNDYRHTGDEAFLRRHLPVIERAVGHIASLRAQRLTVEFAPDSTGTRREPGKPPVPVRAFRGLVPESISHEGYSAKPMHSYWDQFFVLLGLREAVFAAEALGERSLAAAWSRERDDSAACLGASIREAMRAHAIDYIPGCVELGDFDATSTTIALWPCAAADVLPPGALERTFEKYWEFFEARRTGEWEAYTPYELRCVGAMVRLGWKDRAVAALDWFFTHQRPQGWNHWAEVVWRDEVAPKFIGDMPHTWVGSDFINAATAMLVHERDESTLVLFAGIPEAWAREGSGVGFDGLRTRFGEAAASLHAEGGRLTLHAHGRWHAAPPRLAFLPDDGTARSMRVTQGAASRGAGGEVVITQTPCTIVLE